MRLQQTVYMEMHKYDAPFIELKKLRSLAELIFDEFPQKIQTLRLAGAPQAWVTYLSELRLPGLQDLAFGWIDDLKEAWFIDLKDGTFEIAPHRRITDAFLDEVRPFLRPSSPMPPLTTLHLRNVHINVCTEILYYCPYLAEFYCYKAKTMQMGHYGDFPSPPPPPGISTNPLRSQTSSGLAGQRGSAGHGTWHCSRISAYPHSKSCNGADSQKILHHMKPSPFFVSSLTFPEHSAPSPFASSSANFSTAPKITTTTSICYRNAPMANHWSSSNALENS